MNGVPLRFIYDTGAEHTILTDIGLVNLIKLEIIKEIDVYGADFAKKIKAFISKPVKIELYKSNTESKVERANALNSEDKTIYFSKKEVPAGYVTKHAPIIILNEDIFNLGKSEVAFQGILGASFFSNTIVKIDYKKEILTLYPYNYKFSKKGYKEIPVKFRGHKPIIQTMIKINSQDTSIKANILMDTGSSVPILFLENLDPKFKLPEKAIIGQLGIGLGGDLLGYIGLVAKLEIGEFKFIGQISKFQSLDSISVSTINKTRDGIIGNEILKKFTILIDNYRKKLYFKPNKYYYKPIKYDKSGLTLFATGTKHNKYFIKYIIPGSAADLAGLKPNDQIYSVQGINRRFWSIERITKLFKKKENKRIKLKVKRNEKKLKFEFRLKDMFQ